MTNLARRRLLSTLTLFRSWPKSDVCPISESVLLLLECSGLPVSLENAWKAAATAPRDPHKDGPYSFFLPEKCKGGEGLSQDTRVFHYTKCKVVVF